MVNEALLRDRIESPIDFTVADGTGIEKGTLLKLTDPRTAIIATGIGDRLAGIAAREKIASDGRTRLAVFRRGIFDMVASGAILIGAKVSSAGNNAVMAAVAAQSGAAVLGTALETVSDAEVFQVDLNIGIGGAV